MTMKLENFMLNHLVFDYLPIYNLSYKIIINKFDRNDCNLKIYYVNVYILLSACESIDSL